MNEQIKNGDTLYRICPMCNDKMKEAVSNNENPCEYCAWSGSCRDYNGCTIFGLWEDGEYPSEKCVIVKEIVRWECIPRINEEIGKHMFFTREQAEERLKELRDEYK